MMMIVYHANPEFNPSPPLRFISQAVIERLKSGKFVPKRSIATEVENADRRNSLSPLAICKRCIGYQPLVFKDRAAMLWQVVEGLNSAYTKLILVTGQPGSGKTSLLRGVAELMGGGTEQLIWFEISAYSSAISLCETILRQLVCLLESNPEVNGLPLEPSVAPAKTDPIQLQSSYEREKTFQRLAPLMANSKNAPILLVLDDIDPFVSSQERLEAPALKETFNFLLNQPNIKIAIASKRQPYADLKAPPQSILELHLTPFDAPTTQCILERTLSKLNNNQTLETLFAGLLKASQGQPWVVQLLCQLAKQSPESLPLLDLDYQHRLATAANPLPYQPVVETAAVVIEALAHWLLQCPKTQEERLILMVLSFIRHPIDEQVLRYLLPHSIPTFLQYAKQPSLKPFLRKQAEPQTVFNFLEAQLNQQSTATSAQNLLQSTVLFELFPAIRLGILQQLSVQDKLSWHEQLDKFYTEQSLLFPQQRVFSNSDTLTLSREARYHRDKALELGNQLQSGSSNLPKAGYSTPILNNLPTVFTPTGEPIHTPVAVEVIPVIPEKQKKKQRSNPVAIAPKKLKDVRESALFEQLKLAKQSNQAEAYFSTLLNLACYQLEKQDFTAAQQSLQTLEVSLIENPLAKQLSAPQLGLFQAETFETQGDVASKQNQPDKAVGFYHAALNRWENLQTGTPEKTRMAQAVLHYKLMKLYEERQKETLAIKHAEAIFRAFPIQQKALLSTVQQQEDHAKITRFQAESLVLQAKHSWQFQQSKALEAYKQAYHLFLSLHASAEASEQLAAMGKLFWEKNDLTKTRHCFMRALQLDASHSNWDIRCQNQLDFALLAWEEGYPQEAFSALEQVLVLSQKQKLPLWQVKTLMAMADVLADKAGTLMQQKTYLQQAHQLGEGLLSPKGLNTLSLRLAEVTQQLQYSVVVEETSTPHPL